METKPNFKMMLGNYIKLARPDHWIKQMFILPGVAFALALVPQPSDCGGGVPFALRFALGFLSTCLIASANYVINEWIDAAFDRFHPTKKYRVAVTANLKSGYVYAEYALLAILGLGCALFASKQVFWMELWLLVMGVLYNVRPFRLKEIPYVDVLSESVNNAIRLLIGWFIVTSVYLPPVTIVLGYWMGGAFLMATKRYAEYRMINDKTTAALYRKSFARYTEETLLTSAFFYALLAVFFCGVFMIKHRIELLIAVPLMCGLFCYYLHIAYKQDSAAQKPEKLFREKGLMLYMLLFVAVVTALMLIDIPALSWFLGDALIAVGG